MLRIYEDRRRRQSLNNYNEKFQMRSFITPSFGKKIGTESNHSDFDIDPRSSKTTNQNNSNWELFTNYNQDGNQFSKMFFHLDQTGMKGSRLWRNQSITLSKMEINDSLHNKGLDLS